MSFTTLSDLRKSFIASKAAKLAIYTSVEAYSNVCVTFDPYNFEEAAWNADQYKAELAMNRLESE